MRVSVVVFRLPAGTPNRELGRFVKKFYGQETSSWEGKYSYRRRGLLDGIPHRKLLRGVVILRQADLGRVLAFLDEWKAEVQVRGISPTGEDLALLRRAASAEKGRR
ncbi:hypothetical protein B2A_12975 [mine drainage metagenome]|uniref:Uncharacterized protein n=1 Tax=mine drainage metagenome TaxID=410659 RepID=T0YEG8_9ZZZZ